MTKTLEQGNLDPNQATLFELPNQDNFEYKLLVGHDRTDGSRKSSEELRTEYVRRTDDLIHAITEGVEVIDPETGEKQKKPYDYVVWLDKSARPLSWMTKELWGHLATDDEGNVPPQPNHRFVNIDRNQWTSFIDPDSAGLTAVDRVDPTIVRSLRSIFLADPNDRKQGLTERIEDADTQFDGKNVLIVDEVRSSGKTLQYAEGFFRRAFPKANIRGTHWMGDVVMMKGGSGNADLPVWYSDKLDTGRGVGNRNIDRSRLSKSIAQKMGAWFLSTRLNAHDPRSTQLREEIKHLAEDAKKGKMLVEPSRDRGDYEERALRFNEVKSFEDFIYQRKNLGSK